MILIFLRYFMEWMSAIGATVDNSCGVHITVGIESVIGSREAGIHVLEIRRRGARLMVPLSDVTVERNDRFLVALHRRKGGAAKADELT